MAQFKEFIGGLAERQFKITKTASGKEQINQTERNALKKELTEQLAVLLSTEIADTDAELFSTADGLAMEIPNNCIADNITNASGSGAITVCFDLSIKGLDYNALDEQDAYETDKAEKKANAEKRARAKAEKIAYDEKRRKGE